MKVAEFFPSLQGEGKNQGKPCFFIRFAGCNLRCNWCDSPASQTGGREMGPDTLAEKVRQSGLPYVCITGGEPLLQGDELEELLSFLHKRGIIIDIETNGTVDFTRYQPYASICMDVKCPSSGEQSNIGLLSKVRPQDSVKFVVKDEPDCRYAEGVMNSHRIAGEIFFSPVFGTDYSEIYKFILANNLPVRFQIQLHKILGVR